MRHPRPLTAAELHHELELEQEAVVRNPHTQSTPRANVTFPYHQVNRLTRELSSLRAHSASVASTASGVSTSGASSVAPGTDPATWGAGSTHPTGSRSRTRRSSSSVSRTSAAPHRYSMSSQQAAAAPLPQHQGDGGAASARSPSASAALGVSPAAGNGAGSSVARYEEVAAHRLEMEEAKRENEVLRKRIRDLEAELRGRRASDSRERSVSAVSSVGGGGSELSAAPTTAAPAATAAAN